MKLLQALEEEGSFGPRLGSWSADWQGEWMAASSAVHGEERTTATEDDQRSRARGNTRIRGGARLSQEQDMVLRRDVTKQMQAAGPHDTRTKRRAEKAKVKHKPKTMRGRQPHIGSQVNTRSGGQHVQRPESPEDPALRQMMAPLVQEVERMRAEEAERERNQKRWRSGRLIQQTKRGFQISFDGRWSSKQHEIADSILRWF
jgi:hypothetical protein